MRRYRIRRYRIRRFALGLAAFGLASAGGCTSSPTPLAGGEGSAPFADELPVEADTLIVLIHGSGDSPEDWPAEVAAAAQTGAAAQAGGAATDGADPGAGTIAVVRVAWEQLAARRLSAPRRGIRVGEEAAQAIRRHAAQVDRVVLIAHSVGAFVAHGAARWFADYAVSQRESADRAVSRQKTDGGAPEPTQGRPAEGRPQQRPQILQLFLDPFSAKSFVNWKYGVRNFGRYADRAAAWVNTADPVPFTSGFPVHAEGFDVTPPGESGREGHWVPVRLLISRIRAYGPSVPALFEAHGSGPRLHEGQ
jgi:hypothetical protein